MESLDLALRNFFQEFQEIVLKRVLLEKGLRREGTITRKVIKGRVYWYRQRYQFGQAVQQYLGPSNSVHRKKILSLRRSLHERKNQVRELISQERRRISLFRRAGFPVLDPLVASLIERLSFLNLVNRGGMLVGSFAFAAYTGMLGRLFDKESVKTLDIDVVREIHNRDNEARPIELVSPEGFIAIRGKPFYLVPGLSPKSLPSSFVGPGGLRIDFLTPQRGRPKGGTVRLPGLPQVGAEPLPFLDFLINKPVEGVLLGPRGGLAVTVPDPSRYAIHKLIVADRRPVSEGTKRLKDIAQASQLIQACAEERPGEIRKVYREALARGPSWRKSLECTLSALPSEIVGLLK